MPSFKRVIIVAALCAAVPYARAKGETLSRQMRAAVRLYEKHEDVQAMDRFMDILTTGDPSERSMANEYINLITRRMGSGGAPSGDSSPAAETPAQSAPPPRAAAEAPAAPIDEAPAPAVVRQSPPAAEEAPPPAKSATPAAKPVSDEEVSDEAEEVSPARAEVPARKAPQERREAPAAPLPSAGSIDEFEGAVRKSVAVPARPARGEEMSASDKALMRSEIKALLRAAQEKSIADLKAIDGVRVAKRENGDPEAVGIPAAFLFQSGIAFRHDAARLLTPLTRLVFSLGSTQALILPEGVARGEAKVMDMRRIMGISAHLYQAGVAPPRVRINLLNTAEDIPKSMADFKGVVVVFLEHQPMSLVAESAVGDEQGPPASLGIYPSQLRPSRSQGAIIEFSVSEPPAGLTSWKFQLLRPSNGGAELVPLQEVSGSGAVFHQIFWNGRQNYFGEPLPPGRYECVLTATDGKGRQRALHRWVQLFDAPEAAARLPAQTQEESASAKRISAAPTADLPGARAKPLVKQGKSSVSSVQLRRRAKSAKRPRRSPKSTKASAGKNSFALRFNKNSHQMAAASQKTLAAAAKAVSEDSSAVRVVGHAAGDEEGGTVLAERRAKMVAGLLINRYQIEPKRIQISSSVGDQAMVDVIRVSQ